MVRYEDPPGTTKHLRFGCYDTRLWLSDELIRYGVRAIVVHRKGKKREEHPHLHVWWEGSKRTNQTIRDQLKRQNVIFKNEMKSQNDWSFRNHDSYDEWCEYVCKNPTHQLIVADEQLTQVSLKYSAIHEVSYEQVEQVSPQVNTILEDKKEDSWSRIRAAFISVRDRKDYDVRRVRRFISALWLKRGQPIPRKADLDRWSYSLVLLTRFEDCEETIGEDDIVDLEGC